MKDLKESLERLNWTLERQEAILKTFEGRDPKEASLYGKEGIHNAKRITPHYAVLGVGGFGVTMNHKYGSIIYNEQQSVNQKIKSVVGISTRGATTDLTAPNNGVFSPILVTQNFNGNARNISELPLNLGSSFTLDKLNNDYSNVIITPLSNSKYNRVTDDIGDFGSNAIFEAELDNDINFEKTVNRVFLLFITQSRLFGEDATNWGNLTGIIDNPSITFQISTLTYGR